MEVNGIPRSVRHCTNGKVPKNFDRLSPLFLLNMENLFCLLSFSNDSSLFWDFPQLNSQGTWSLIKQEFGWGIRLFDNASVIGWLFTRVNQGGAGNPPVGSEEERGATSILLLLRTTRSSLDGLEGGYRV